MSLINQVLQDLDRRHANGGGVPSAVKALPSASGGARYWRVVAISAVGVLVIGGGAGFAAWSTSARSVPVAIAAPVARAPAAAPTPVQTPVVVVTAASAPAAVVAPAVLAASAVTVDVARKPIAEAPVKPTAAASAPQTLVAVAPPSMVHPAPSTAPAVATESRIEKRPAARTARERAEAEYQRGVAAHQHGQLAEAAAAYTAALREEASFVSARQAMAGVMIHQGRSDDARSLLSEGLALAPQHAGFAMTLARLHAERGELQRAADVLQASNAASMSAEDHAFRAAILQRLNRHAEASEHFAAALRTAPDNGVWWMGLGMSQAAEGRNDNAKEAFNRARATGSLSPELAQYVEQRLRQL